MTLTKVEIADSLIQKFDLTKREAKDLVESFFEEIRVALESGDDVKLSGFGNFQLRDKNLARVVTRKPVKASRFPLVGWLCLNRDKSCARVSGKM
jgi:nucleoid DNA-binding protein